MFYQMCALGYTPPYTLIFILLDKNQEDKRLWTKQYQEFLEYNLLLILSCMYFRFISAIPKYASASKVPKVIVGTMKGKYHCTYWSITTF